MEYAIPVRQGLPEPEALESALHAVDPAAVVDRDPASGALRVASVVGIGELAELVTNAGCDIAPAQITRIPSICCGGCSG
jgi:hypothetical protein